MTDSTAEIEVDVADPLGTPRSFAEFYETEAESIHRALRATVASPTVAREAVDEAMARAYERWAVVGAYDAPAGWVYRTALNWSISWWRKHRREHPLPTDDAHRAPGAEVDPEGALALDALRTLPLDQRSVVVCRVLLDLDTRATAAALDIAEGTVKSRLSRGLDALRAELEVQP
ncbi:MAG: RNA polymerase sigma factor [Aquihabitans sp.]